MLDQNSLNSFIDVNEEYFSLSDISTQEVSEGLDSTNNFSILADTIANDTRATATKRLYNSTKTIQINDSIGAGDVFDWYNFQITSQANHTFSIGGLLGDSTVELYNDRNLLLHTGVFDSTTSTFTFEKELITGNYYLKIGNISVNNYDYTITLSSTPINLSWSTQTGYGFVDAAAAVAKATNSLPFPNVPNLGGRKNFLDTVKAPEVWAKGYTGKGVVVAVLDTGVDINHTEFAGQIWTNEKEIAGNGIDDDANGYIDDVNGWDFINRDNLPLDDNSHGTHVAGIIDQVAPDVKIMPVKVMNNSGFGGISGIAWGIRYAVENGANIINLSLGSTFYTNTLRSALIYATSKGVLVTMAAGNNGTATPIYPAAFANEYGIAVGAYTSWSNKSGSVPLDYVVAPGNGIYSTIPNNRWGNKSGTSMAAPVVAGIAALLKSANSSFTPTQIEDFITTTAANRTISKPSAPLPTVIPPTNAVASINSIENTTLVSSSPNRNIMTFLQFSTTQQNRFEEFKNSLEEYDPLTGQRKDIFARSKKSLK